MFKNATDAIAVVTDAANLMPSDVIKVLTALCETGSAIIIEHDGFKRVFNCHTTANDYTQIVGCDKLYTVLAIGQGTTERTFFTVSAK